ncbi:hypothetical protein [Flagellimonas sp.]|uniref:hypothetical protein n=1 Tax=Flagellimonas sp. TaxID=2058762 RepID=UPI003BAB5685
MKSIVFRNRDKKAIKILMREIGAYRYETALEQMKVEQRPLSMEGFYLEANDDCIFLCHRYPSGYILKLMKVEYYAMLPRDGWELIKV